MTNDLMTKNMGIYGYHNFLLIRAFINNWFSNQQPLQYKQNGRIYLKKC